MQFHGAAQRGRCWAEDPGDALGKESACSVWLVVFLQPFVTSAAGEDELKQPGTPQHGESSSRSWTRASTSRAPSPSPAGGQCFSEPSRTPARRARLHCPHRTQGAICCVPSCPPWLECVFHGPVAGTHRLGLGSFQGTPGSHWGGTGGRSGHEPAVLPRHCNCGQLGAVPGHRDISAMLITQAHWGRLFPDHRSVAGWDTVSTSAETLSVEHSPALPCSSFKEPGGNPLPTRSDPSQILPLSNTFLFRLRNCRSSA